MSLFDHVVCRYPLPDLPEEGTDWMFQTKDLERNMWTYTITSSGQLVCDITQLESIPHHQRTEKSPVIFRSVLVEKNAVSTYSGFMEFGYYRCARATQGAIDINYLAYFVDGVLQGVQQCEHHASQCLKEKMRARIEKDKIEQTLEIPQRLRTKKI